MIYPFAFFAAAAVTALSMKPLAIIARHCGLLDVPNARKVHTTVIPRVGGIAIMASSLCVLLSLLAYSDYLRGPFRSSRTETIGLLIATAFIGAVGVLDDRLNIRSKVKLVFLVAAAALVWKLGVRVDTLSLGAMFSVPLGWLSLPLTVLWIVGVTVSINFIDGLDGLAGGIAAICAGVLAITAYTHGEIVATVLSLTLLGSLVGFLVHNFHPAKVFLGDGGSMSVGFLLGCLGITASGKAETLTTLLIPALALGIPITDSALTLIRRGVLQRRSLFSAERGHVHHRLLDLGFNQRKVVLILYFVTALIASSGVVFLHNPQALSLTYLAAAVGVMLTLFRSAGSVRVRETMHAFRRNRHINRLTVQYRNAFEDAQLRLRIAKTFDAWWREVSFACEAFGFTKIALPTPTRDGGERVVEWSRPDVDPTTQVIRTTIPVKQRRVGGPLMADVEVAVCDSLEAAGLRLTFFARLMEEQSLASLPDDTIQPRRTHLKALLVGDRESKPKRPKLAEPSPLKLAIQQLEDLGKDGTGATSEIPQPGPRIAVVHDFLYIYAGAERVLEQILNVFPDAELFSLFDFLPEGQRDFIKNKPVRSTFIQKLPFARQNHRRYLPLMPLAIEQLDLSGYDIVISSSYLAAKGVITKPDQMHICYCHSPVRYAWDLQHQYLSQAGLISGFKSIFARTILHYIRNWDVRSANGVDVFLANSDFVGRRIQKVYRRGSTTVHPPVDVDKFTLQSQKEDFYLTVSRLVPYKRIDAVVEAFASMPEKRLIVVGDGPEYDRLKALAGPNVKLVGHQSFESLRTYMQRARAFVFAAEEDFGIVPVEAQACGTPVIAYGQGGAVETIVEGKTGLFFSSQTTDCIRDAIRRFEAIERWDAHSIRENACRFSPAEFCQRFRKEVQGEWISFCKMRPRREGMVVPSFEISTDSNGDQGSEVAQEIIQTAQAG